MSREIVKYAMFSSFYKDSVLDCFYPFCLTAMERGIAYSPETLQIAVHNNHALAIPVHVIRSLVKHGIAKTHLGHKGSEKNPFPVFLTVEADLFLSTITDSSEVEREIGLFQSKLALYFEHIGIAVPQDSLSSRLETMIQNNIVHFCDFFLGRSGGSELDGIDSVDGAILDFILLCDRQDPELFRIIEGIFHGSLYKSFLSLTEQEVEGVVTKDYSKTKVYFDANFLFSLIGLHDEEYSKPAQELFELLKNNKFQFRFYDFTLDEMIHVLRGFEKAKTNYPESVRINSLYSSLKRKNYDSIRVHELVVGLASRLEDLKIYPKATEVDIDNFTAEDGNVSNELRKIKPKQPDYYHNHDVAILEKAKKYHKSRIYRFEDMDSIFVTADFLLAKLGRQLSNHEAIGSISEIFLDRVLTNLLFLKNPQSKVSLGSILSVFKRETFIKRSVWDKFYDTLKRLGVDGKINQNDIVNLFCNQFVENELRYMTDQDAETLDDEMIVEMIDRAAEMNKVVADEVAKKQDEALQNKEIEFSKKVLQFESEAEKQLVDQKAKTANTIRKRAKKSVHRTVIVLRILAGLLLIIPVYPVYGQIIAGGLTFDLLSIIRYVFFVLDTVAVSIKGIWEWIEGKVGYSIIKREFREFDIDEEP